MDDNSYDENSVTTGGQTNFKVKLLKSSYTGGRDNEGNPIYVKGSGDLDICNGITSKTPEYPRGIFHYVCTIDLNSNGLQKLSASNTYGYLNEETEIVSPSYPYVIGAYKGLPEKSNFNTQDTVSVSTASTVDQITTYTINFKTLKTVNNKFNNEEFSSIQISQDDNYLNLRPNPHPYIWNFTNNLEEDGFFGKDNKHYTNKISNLKSLDTDLKFKAFGTIKKFITKGSVAKGLAVRLVNNTRTENGTSFQTLEIELYNSSTGINESVQGAAFLGISLNDAEDGNVCYVCTQGITTVKIGNSLTQLKCGSYGMLAFANQNGYVLGLEPGDSISSDVPVAGYFLEDLSNITMNNLILFNVQGNFEFN